MNSNKLKIIFSLSLFRVFLLGVSFLLLPALNIYAQNRDSLEQKKSIENGPVQQVHSPKKAVIMSAVIPGLGQAYNRKYWKIPIIYAGFTGIGALALYWNKNYTEYKQLYIYSVQKDTLKVIDYFGRNIPSDNLYNAKETFRRYRDLSYISFAVLYLLNIIDANVDAHLYTFDVSDDLSIHIRPYVNPTVYTKPTFTGLTFTIKL